MRGLVLLASFLRIGFSFGFAGQSVTLQQHGSSNTLLRASRAATKKASRTKWVQSRGFADAVMGNSDVMTLFSPCKINLFLRIIRKREDGYHDLASLFQAVGFGDTLELKKLDETATEDVFSCNMEGVPTDMTNLVLRALELMREKTGVKLYFDANLIKQVPAQAGLGGGSANAATAMWGANELMGNPASLEDMIEWSGALGSDITFFLSRGTAYCTGRGEVMTPTDPLLEAGTKLCIVKPNVGLSTPSVFKALNYDELSALDPDEVLLPQFLNAESVNVVPGEYYVNDLEPPAFRCVPELGELKERLKGVDGFKHVMMSGSGTSIFCIGEPSDPEQFQKDFGEDENLKVMFTEFINRKEGVWFERP